MLLYHAGLPAHSGYVGVDVFFVISGYLISGLLLRELNRTGRISWPRFLARRVRRLLPAAVLVLVLTALATYLIVPGARRNGIGLDIAAAGTYAVNWLFAGRFGDVGVDIRPSPVQHFWSLSVEEQFYLVWPLALGALALVTRRFRAPAHRVGVPSRRAVGLLLAAIAIPSFAYAVWQSRVDPGPAYYVTTTRAWELGIGAALAIWLSGPARGRPASPAGAESAAGLKSAGGCESAAGLESRVQFSAQNGPNRPKIALSTGAAPGRPSIGAAVGRIPAGMRATGRAALGWFGLAGVFAAAVIIPANRTWPSWWTLLPTLGAAAVIWAGSIDQTGSSDQARPTGQAGPTDAPGPATNPGNGPVRLLGLRPMVWIGGLSYSLYLWHWPLVILTEWQLGHTLATPAKVLVVAGSVIPAYLGYRFVEQPIHHGRRLADRTRFALAIGAGLSAAAVLAAVPLITAGTPFPHRAPAGTDLLARGAASLPASPADPTRPDTSTADPSTARSFDWLAPDPMRAGDDRPVADGCLLDHDATEPVPCVFGPAGATRELALVGDSKALQWLPALEAIAAREGWRITTYVKTGCAFSTAPALAAGAAYPQCDAFNAALRARLTAHPPEVVVTSSGARSAWGSGGGDALIAGLARQWADLRAQGSAVLVIGDNPTSPNDLDICAGRNPERLDRCAFDRTSAVELSAGPLQREAAQRGASTSFFDPAPWLCPLTTCPVAIDHLVINRPGDHVTATYAASLAAPIALALGRALAAG